MNVLFALGLLIVSACSAEKPIKWNMVISDGIPTGAIRETHTEDIKRATATYEAFLTELDARYLNVINADEITHQAIRAALVRLNPHAEVIPPDGPPPCESEIGIGAILTRDYKNNIVISQLTSQSPAAAVGISVGNIILEVDGTSVAFLSSGEIAERIICNGKNSVILTVEQHGVVVTKNIQKKRNTFVSIVDTMLGPDTYYIWISDLEPGMMPQIIRRLQTLRGSPNINIIFDLRSMRGGGVSAGNILLSLFLPAQSTTMWYGKTSLLVPALYTPLPNKLVVLTNKLTASLGEVIAGALKDYGRATLIGEKTLGFGTALGEVTLPDGTVALIPHTIYRGPAFTDVEGVGVTPNILVEDTNPYGYYIPSIPDAILSKAIAYMEETKTQYTKAP